MICKDMGGSKCASEFCDFWNNKLQICNLALESKLNVALAARRLKKMRAKIYKDNASKKARGYAIKYNLVDAVETEQ